MTEGGISKLVDQFNADKMNDSKTIYKLEQLFSTSTKANVANDFPNRCHDAVKVLFTVSGNSSCSMSAPNGLKFVHNEGKGCISHWPILKLLVSLKTLLASLKLG